MKSVPQKIDFTNLEYLKVGNSRQKLAYRILTTLAVFEKLEEYTPFLAGTIPLDIDLPDSDLDIVCYSENLAAFSQKVTQLFSQQKGFDIQYTEIKGKQSIVASFETENFKIEIFAQQTPVSQQMAYLHLLKEYEILMSKEEAFKHQIRALKAHGVKTEPAFAQLLNLEGDPYETLLEFNVV